MLISFFNPSDLIGCGWDINQSDSFRYTEGYVEGVCRGVCRGVHGRGMQRGYMEGYTEGCMEGCAEGCVVVIAPSNHKFSG